MTQPNSTLQVSRRQDASFVGRTVPTRSLKVLLYFYVYSQYCDDPCLASLQSTSSFEARQRVELLDRSCLQSTALFSPHEVRGRVQRRSGQSQWMLVRYCAPTSSMSELDLSTFGSTPCLDFSRCLPGSVSTICYPLSFLAQHTSYKARRGASRPRETSNSSLCPPDGLISRRVMHLWYRM